MNCSITGELGMNGIENLSVNIGWFKPTTRKGIISKYLLGGRCVDRYWRKSVLELAQSAFPVSDEERNSYQLVMTSLPSFSTCNISVTAVTGAGPGESTHCQLQTPLVCILLLLHQLNLMFRT